MGDGSLSQDEIDALLSGTDDMISPSAAATPSSHAEAVSGSFTTGERNNIRDAVSSIISAAAPTMSGMLSGREISISNALIDIKNQEQLRSEFPGQYIQVSLDYTGGLPGKNLLVFNQNDAGAISSLMMGDDSGAAPPEISDAHMSTLQELSNQLLSTLATQLGNRMGVSISTTPAVVSPVTNQYELQLPAGNELIKMTYDMNIEGVLSSKLYHIFDSGLASGIAKSRAGAQPAQDQSGQQMYPQQSQANISSVRFPPLDEGVTAGTPGNINLLLDVPMTMTVELGRTTQLVQEILGLGEGSIIELDKLAGEPVDLLVNGKLIAKGEVVVIDENFGVRVTDIVSPQQRLLSTQ